MYIQNHFDLSIKSDLSNEGPMSQWSGLDYQEPEAGEYNEIWWVLVLASCLHREILFTNNNVYECNGKNIVMN